MSNGSLVTLVTLVLIVAVVMPTVYLISEYRDQKDLERQIEWRRRFEPNRENVVYHMPFTTEDQLTERPLLPEDYRNWRSDDSEYRDLQDGSPEVS